MKEAAHRKLFVGPMSVAVVDAVKDSELSKKVGLIPSRRQVEYSGGYVNNWTTSEFLKYSEGIVRCRDHSGPLQGDSPDDGLESLSNDCSQSDYFEIIHIDPWKQTTDVEASSLLTCKLIEYCSSINSKILFEIGTEQGIRPYSVEELDNFLSIVEKSLGSLFERIIYCVIQGGTGLKGTSNIGKFDERKCEKMISLCHSRGVFSKEHNGDYLQDEDLTKRFEMGLDSINIAPELGVNESLAFVEKINASQLEDVYSICYDSKKWKKWFAPGHEPSNESEKLNIVKASCHYNFSHPKIKTLMESVGINRTKSIDLHLKFLERKLNLIEMKLQDG